MNRKIRSLVLAACALTWGAAPLGAQTTPTTPTTAGLVLNSIDVVGGELGLIGFVVNPLLDTTLADGTTRLLFEIRGLDDVTVQNDPMISVAVYNGLDTDMNPADDFSGTEEFVIDALSVNPDGSPISLFEPGSIVAGDLTAGPATLDLFAVIGISLTGVLLEGVVTPNGAGFTTTPFTGAVPAVILDQIDNPGLLPGTLLDLLTFLGANEDIDLDGDGTNDAFSVDIELGAVSCVILPPVLGTPYLRGDCDGDGTTNITDAVKTLQYLFLNDLVECQSACDADDDGAVNITDPVALLQYLFSGATAPPEPFGMCGVDPTGDALTCDAYPSC